MKKIKKIEWWRVALVAASLISIAVDHRDVFAIKTPAVSRQSIADSLTVSISAPVVNGKRTITRRNGVPHLQVMVSNSSDSPQQVWTETCSEGNDSVTLEIFAIDGRTLQKPITVRRGGTFQLWTSNYIQATTVRPGERALREISLYPYKSEEEVRADSGFRNHFYYLNFPPLSGGEHTLRIRAAFEEKPRDWMNSDDVWSGRVVSPAQNYTVNGPYL